MAITPAHRVSQALKAGGVQTVHPESPRQGVKVKNNAKGLSLEATRRHGSPVVTVFADIEIDDIAARRAVLVAQVLREAGYDCEIGAGGHHVYVREPGWQRHLGEAGRLRYPTPEPAPGAPDPAAPVDRIAVRLRDGHILIHRLGCPELTAVPGKQYPVTGATVGAVAAELVGKALPKGTDPAARSTLRVVNVHDCPAETTR